MRDKTLYLCEKDVYSLTDMDEVVKITEQVYMAHGQGQVAQPVKQAIFMDPIESHRNLVITMPSWVKPFNAVGLKLGFLYFDNAKRGLETAYGLMIVGDPVEGRPYAIMDATSTTALRTAAHSAVAAKYLAKKDAHIMAAIGCGVQARTHLEAFQKVRKVDTVLAYDIKKVAAEKYCEDVERQFGVKATVCSSGEEAVGGADIVCVATTSTTPVVYEGWVRPGAFVTGLFGLYDLDPKLTSACDKWVVGDIESDGHTIIEDVYGWLKTPINAEDIYTEMGQVVAGKKPGRESDEERILYTHFGMGSFDIALGKVIYDRAVERNVGVWLPL